jgi:hypothetical protein
MGATKVGHEYESDFRTGNLVELIETLGGGSYFLDGQTDNFYHYTEVMWLGKPSSLMERKA